MYILILSFLASFIPPFREYLKKELKKFFIFIGISLFLMETIMSIFVFPKLVGLYRNANYSFDEQKGIIMLIVGFLVSSLITLIGFKFVGSTKSNLAFYLLFALLIVLTYLVIAVHIYTIIDPIYTLTNSLN